MQGKKTFELKIFYELSLDRLVPEDNFYRKINSELQLGFLYKATSHYYGNCGQDSIDPVVFFKILLVGYLNNLSSDRALLRFCSDSLAIRLFLGYDLDEELPWHSTISRTRALFGEELFMKLFQKILSLCIDKGMVRGKRQAVDSAFVKANASMDSLVEKQVLEDASAFVNELEENSDYKALGDAVPTVTPERKKLIERHHAWKEKEYKDMPGANKNQDRTDEDGNPLRPKFLSNHTHYSPTDPDAKISVKPGKARQLNYAGQIAVDDKNHIITGACASTAGSKDSAIMHEIMDRMLENLKQHGIRTEEALLDAGYSSGESLEYCEKNGINAFIPNFGQYKPEREGFEFVKGKTQEEDYYRCTQKGGKGAVLPFKRILTDSKGYQKKSYRSSERDCRDCPLRTECCGRVTKFKKIEDSIHKPLYDRMHEKLNRDKNYTRFLTKRRSSTVEPVLGTLINYHSMRRVNTRGMKNANKHVLMAALSYNLKKYLKFSARKPQSNVQMMNLSKGILRILENRLYQSLKPSF